MKSRAGVLGGFTTPFSRVVAAASAARKKYQPFTAADVTAEMIRPEVQVIALSRPSMKDERTIANVEAVIIMPRGSKDPSKAIQPQKTSEVSEDYQNLFGAEVHGRGVVATFPVSVVNDANEVRVVYDVAVGPGFIQSCTDCGIQWKLDRVR
jgi:hypothetical protein